MINGQDEQLILIVDDIATNLEVLSTTLISAGFKVAVATDGESAIEQVDYKPPDLIVLDVMMPGIDGFETCHRLKENPLTREIPVIFMTALSETVNKVKGFSLGAVDYLTKPIQSEEVLARVRTHLQLQSQAKALKEQNALLKEEIEQRRSAEARWQNTLEQLEAAQSQIIAQEKLAALGQLVAGIAHEINTPLGAIRSCVGNLSNFFNDHLHQLPSFFQGLSPERQSDLLALLQYSSRQTTPLSTREQRQLKRRLRSQLESYAIEKAVKLANLLAGIGVYEEFEEFLPLLKDPDNEMILTTAYQLANLYTSTRNITTAVERATKVVFALKTYARYDSSGEKIDAQITDGIDTVLTLYHNQLKHGVDVYRHYDDSLPVIRCYPDELNQVWTNLIHNALQAMENKGNLIINVRQEDDQIKVSITDTGKGIPPEIQPKIFQPFFTTKPAGEGSGLGLDIVRKIVEKHHGHMEVESVPGETTFTVSLPIQQPQPMAEEVD
ncbi:response regulator [Moorena producens JHB]|uniref:histidine kinase n=1 Tax=Moorena producens (strain JHB) TaxID=1454205 RepID=A0A1D9FTJ4_MOOP1|nr:response regulator [Moorena producens]AOY78677.1 response regulator [Moorena producens JHB]